MLRFHEYEVGKKVPVKFEIGSQEFRQGENNMAMIDRFEHLLLNEFGPEKRAFGAATRAKASPPRKTPH